MNQRSTGNRPLLTTNGIVIWTAKPPNEKGQYLAIFNRGEIVENIALAWNEVGLEMDKGYAVRDLWEHTDLGQAASLKLTLQPHGCVLYRVGE